MAVIFDNQERNLIPNWRSFDTTVVLGELDSFSTNGKISPNLSIGSYIDDFQQNRTVPFAADLISASIVNGFNKEPIVMEAANFIVSNKNKVTKSQYEISKKILLSTENQLDNTIDNITHKQLENCLQKEYYFQQIQELKKYTIKFPYNPIAWVDISRCYSILGQKEQAIKTMKIAIQIASSNRFVLRSAVRLFTHYQEIELAHDILRKNSMTKIDPWLMSAEISAATLRGRNSNFIKKGVELVDSRNLSPFSITELASSIGTIELLSGDRKRSKKMFTKSLILPNDNSLAQIEWILNNKDKSLINNEQLNFAKAKHSFEAKAISNYYDKKLIESLNNTCQWLYDMPFAKKPIIMGSSIAALLDNRNLAIEFLKKGLISHFNDAQILNNIAYYLALENRTEEAIYYVEKAKNQGINKSTVTEACLIATYGLICFRENKLEEGRAEYLKAIEKTTVDRSTDLNKIAILNYAREEILAKTNKIEDVMNLVSQISLTENSDISLKKLKKEVEELYQRYKHL